MIYYRIYLTVMALGRHPVKTADSHAAIRGRSRDFIEKITLYDKRNKEIGNIYPRRAKQLVLKKRAVWLDEGRALKMISNITNSSSANIKEEAVMIEDSVYPTNDRPERIATLLNPEKADSLLLYQAKQNVRDRKNLIKHVVAFAVAGPVVGLFYIGFIQDMVSPEWWSVSNALETLREATPHIPEDYVWAVNEVQWAVERYLFHGYTPGVWYVILGVLLAWGGWIAARSAKLAAKSIKKKLWTSSTKKVKPDPVIQEYNRLKNMTTDEMM